MRTPRSGPGRPPDRRGRAEPPCAALPAAAAELCYLTRDDERAAAEQRRLLGRLRRDLLDFYPQALVALPAIESPTSLAFLARWSSAEAARCATAPELAAFFRAHRHGWPTRMAARVRDALDAPAIEPPPHLARAKEGTVRLLAEQLLLLHRQRAAWESRLRELQAGGQAPA